MESKIDGIESRLGVLESRMDVMESKIEAMESRLGVLESRMDVMESKIEAMESRLGVLESSLGVMESKMEEIQGTLASVHKSQMMYENIHFPKISVALDGYTALSEKSKEHEEKITILGMKAERCDIDIAYLKSVARG